MIFLGDLMELLPNRQKAFIQIWNENTQQYDTIHTDFDGVLHLDHDIVVERVYLEAFNLYIQCHYLGG